MRFLGKEANVPGGMAVFARQAGVPIFPAIILRTGWTSHRGAFGPTVWPDCTVDKRQDWQRMTQQVFDFIDSVIRAHPDQWFWFNKRWILDPVPGRTDTPAPPPPAGAKEPV